MANGPPWISRMSGFFRGVEIGGLHQPALHFRFAAGNEVDFLCFRQVHASQQARVDAG